MRKKTFEEWMRLVNDAAVKTYGIDIGDLPDINFLDLYNDGYSPKQAAKRCIRNARDE